MTTSALMVRDDSRLELSITPAGERMKSEALEYAALIGRVTTPAEQETACAAQSHLTALLGLVEKARKAAKEPVLNFGRTIDATAAKFIEEIKSEQVRIAGLVGSYQALERQRIVAAQAAENKRLSDLERERMAELARAKTLDEVDKVQEKFNNRAQEEAAPIRAVPKVEGQRVTEEWVIEVTDIWLLAKSHPTCVKLDALKGEIKSLLNAGVKVAGVRASREVRSRTTSYTPKAIEV